MPAEEGRETCHSRARPGPMPIIIIMMITTITVTLIMIIIIIFGGEGLLMNARGSTQHHRQNKGQVEHENGHAKIDYVEIDSKQLKTQTTEKSFSITTSSRDKRGLASVQTAYS